MLPTKVRCPQMNKMTRLTLRQVLKMKPHQLKGAALDQDTGESLPTSARKMAASCTSQKKLFVRTGHHKEAITGHYSIPFHCYSNYLEDLELKYRRENHQNGRQDHFVPLNEKNFWFSGLLGSKRTNILPFSTSVD